MRFILFLSAALGLAIPVGFAQPASPACHGSVAVIRVSEVKPGGTMSGLLAAVAAQKEWYRANGVNDNEIFAARVMVTAEGSRDRTYSEKQILTYHINPPSRERTPNRGDAAWNAFVKLYQDNSEIKSEYQVCLPKDAHK